MPAGSQAEFNLQPHPRILPMLGEINLAQWKCIAELIDNSVDGFLIAMRAGQSIEAPEITVAVPLQDNAGAKVTVRDNGPGMTRETLENAVRAGWTGNDPVSNLGMFGMGFNIATARLGTVTKVWSTRRGDREWNGLEIDFDRLMQQGHYNTPILTRPKADSQDHGTEVSVEKLKPEQRQFLARTANQSKMKKELAKAYSSMLRPNGAPISFALKFNGPSILPRSHCIWGGDGNADRSINSPRHGVINAFQMIDSRMADRRFCSKCWQWLAVDADRCPACSTDTNVIVRERHVHGWLGIQRYLSQADYGIDFIRHGRKIEIGNRDLFMWNDDETNEAEYPIDDPRNRGRIVGEIHLDHCRVTYTKDRFDRTDPAWEDMVKIVRGEGPLRPDKAAALGCGQNTSPLFLLFQAFRRSSPKPKVAGCYARLLLVPNNDRAEDMAKRFQAGEPEYQTDAKWWELVQEADNELLVNSQSGGGATGPSAGGPDGGVPGDVPPIGGDSDGTPDTGTPSNDSSGPRPEPLRQLIASLSQEYRDDLTSQRWEIRAYAVQPNDPIFQEQDRPWTLRRNTTGVHDFYVVVENPIFQSATMTLLDALLAELAWWAMDFLHGQSTPHTFSAVLASLRNRYATVMKLDPQILSGNARLTINDICASLSANLNGPDARALFEALPPADKDAIYHRMAVRSVANPQDAINGGHFLEYAPTRTVLRFFSEHPELFFDDRYFDVPFATIEYGTATATQEARSQITRYYECLLTDAGWLVDSDVTDLNNASRARLLRSALALELLDPSKGADESH